VAVQKISGPKFYSSSKFKANHASSRAFGFSCYDWRGYVVGGQQVPLLRFFIHSTPLMQRSEPQRKRRYLGKAIASPKRVYGWQSFTCPVNILVLGVKVLTSDNNFP